MKLAIKPPVHPGEILREEFLAPLGNERGRAREAYPCAAHPHRASCSRIQSDHAGRGAAARKVVFATLPEFWMNLQTTFDLTFKGLQAPNLKVLSPNFLPLPPPFNRIPDVAPCSAVSRQKGSSADGRTLGLAARGVEARSWAV
jgi:antitoxin HigA-1